MLLAQHFISFCNVSIGARRWAYSCLVHNHEKERKTVIFTVDRSARRGEREERRMNHGQWKEMTSLSGIWRMDDTSIIGRSIRVNRNGIFINIGAVVGSEGMFRRIVGVQKYCRIAPRRYISVRWVAEKHVLRPRRQFLHSHPPDHVTCFHTIIDAWFIPFGYCQTHR